MSFDAQLAELTDRKAACNMLGDLPLAATEPFVASSARLNQLVAMNAAIDIMVPANHPAFIDDDDCTPPGVRIAGDAEFSYAIPAWRLFDRKNHFGSLDAVTSIRPVRA